MNKAKTSDQPDQVTIQTDDTDTLCINLHGRIDYKAASKAFSHTKKILKKSAFKAISVDAENLTYCDSSAAAFIAHLKKHQQKTGHDFKLINPKAGIDVIVKMFENTPPATKEKHSQHFCVKMIEDLGRAAHSMFKDTIELIEFTGELFRAFLNVIAHPRQFRFTDTLAVAESAGANAFGIITALGFLIGLILAFQSAISLKQFGAEIFVADLVALSLIKFLGPFMTAIIVAGRSGSAFAAELGTMKTNEEIDALTTMGIDPVRFLVVSKVTAGAIALPLLSIFTVLAGLIGAGVVVIAIGFSPIAYFNQVVSAINLADIVEALFKATIFGILISSIGCLRGLQAQPSARAVGDAATRAVVSSIVLLVCTEGIFAVVHYFLSV